MSSSSSITSAKLCLSILGAGSILYGLFILGKKRLEKRTGMPVCTSIFDLFPNDDPKKMMDLVREKGDVLLSTFGFFSFVNVGNPDVIKFILKKEEGEGVEKIKVASAPSIGKLQGDSIFSSNGEDWERHKTMVKEFFDHSAVKSFTPSFVSVVESLGKHLDEFDGKEIDMYPWFTKSTLDVLGLTVFGYNFHGLEGEKNEYVDTYQLMVEQLFNPVWLLFPWLEKVPIPLSKRLLKVTSGLTDLLNKIVDDHEQKRLRGEKSENPSMIELALNSIHYTNSILSKEELRSNVFTFFIAGHEATATALCWETFYLALYPEIQEKLYQEIYSVIGDRHPTYEDLKNLGMLNRFIKEVMRMEPPLTQTPTRTATEDLHVDGTRYVIPKGTSINILIKSVHHDPRFWDKPEEFNPDRFLPENSKKRHPFAYLPFSVGRRACTGMQYSHVEQQIFICMLVQRFRFSTNISYLKKRRGFLSTVETCPIVVHRRDKTKQKE